MSIRSNLRIEIQQNFNRKRPGSRVVSSVKVTVTNFEGVFDSVGTKCLFLFNGRVFLGTVSQLRDSSLKCCFGDLLSFAPGSIPNGT